VTAKDVRLFFKSREISRVHPVEISDKITLNTSGYSPTEVRRF